MFLKWSIIKSNQPFVKTSKPLNTQLPKMSSNFAELTIPNFVNSRLTSAKSKDLQELTIANLTD
jgi:hypothetical protein